MSIKYYKGYMLIKIPTPAPARPARKRKPVSKRRYKSFKIPAGLILLGWILIVTWPHTACCSCSL